MGNKIITRSASFRGRVWKRPYNQPMSVRYDGQVLSLGYTRTGSHNPKYRSWIKSGLNASGDMTVTVQNSEAEDRKDRVIWRTSTDPNQPAYSQMNEHGVEGIVTNTGTPVIVVQHSGSSSMVNARAIAIRCLQRKWTARRRQFQGGVFLAEFGKTVQMVVKPAKALQSKALSFSRRASKLAKRLPRGDSWRKTMADTWLEATFGWRPLLADINDGARALARTVTRDVLERQQFRCFGQDEQPVTQSVLGHGPIGYDGTYSVWYTTQRSVVSRSIVILYGVWSAKTENSSSAASSAWRLASLSGFNWEDVAPQVWEVIPWSFLVDYFINVGDVIEASCNTLNGPLWVEEVNILETEDLRKITLNVPFTKDQYAGKIVSIDGPDTTCKGSYRTVTRKEYTGPLQPTLRFQLPVDMQWLNIAALAAGGKPFTQPFIR